MNMAGAMDMNPAHAEAGYFKAGMGLVEGGLDFNQHASGKHLC